MFCWVSRVCLDFFIDKENLDSSYNEFDSPGPSKVLVSYIQVLKMSFYLTIIFS